MMKETETEGATEKERSPWKDIKGEIEEIEGGGVTMTMKTLKASTDMRLYLGGGTDITMTHTHRGIMREIKREAIIPTTIIVIVAVAIIMSI